MSRKYNPQKFIQLPLRRKRIIAKKKTYLAFAVNYLIQLQKTIYGNQTNVYQIRIYQLVDIMSAKKKEGNSCLLFDDYLDSWYVVYVAIKKIYLQSSSKIQLHTKN